MYKRTDNALLKPMESFALSNGAVVTAVATLEDEYGGKCQIAIDDHCYVLYLMHEDEKKIYYKPTHHIFREAHDALKELPAPE